MKETGSIVELQNISFGYPGANSAIFQGMHFSFGTGKMGLIGPNGSGKTTLFHLVMGLIHPLEGKVLFKGKPMLDEKGFMELRKNIGFMFQDADDQLFSPTVIEDVAFGPLNLNMTSEKAYEIAHQTLVNLRLENLEQRVTHKLSGGEKKLVSLATILVMQPELLLLDEPTNNLDQETRHRLIDILNNLELSYAIISHDWDFLEQTTEEVYSIEGGSIVSCDKACLHEHHHAHPAGDYPHHHANGNTGK